jgi:hypothetical protein
LSGSRLLAHSCPASQVATAFRGPQYSSCFFDFASWRYMAFMLWSSCCRASAIPYSAYSSASDPCSYHCHPAIVSPLQAPPSARSVSPNPEASLASSTSTARHLLTLTPLKLAQASDAAVAASSSSGLTYPASLRRSAYNSTRLPLMALPQNFLLTAVSQPRRTAPATH